jgi:hypothetical protein
MYQGTDLLPLAGLLYAYFISTNAVVYDTLMMTVPSTLASHRQTLYCLLYSERKSKT